MRKCGLAVGLLLSMGAWSSAFAQSPVPINPQEVACVQSPDQALIQEYEVGFFLAGAVAPVQTQRIVKTPPAADGLMHLLINSRAITTFGQYEVRVRVNTTNGATPPVITSSSVWAAGGPNSDQPIPFSRAALPPASLQIVR